MNRLLVVDKPIFVSSNRRLARIKRELGIKKAGFSGTLDPFATGCLVVATGAYTKLLPYLQTSPKTYRATLWLGATSPSLDLENIASVTHVAPLPLDRIAETLHSLQGTLTYTPPSFSAKKLNGRRAYDLAREGKEVPLQTITSHIHTIRLIHYTHPFVTFEATVSAGTYIRSLGCILGQKLGVPATLSALRRLREGAFYVGMRNIDPFAHLSIARNRYFGDDRYLETGKPLHHRFFKNQTPGTYLVETDRFYAIIAVEARRIRYKLNRIPKPEV